MDTDSPAREDFSAATRRKLAGRAGNVCSVPTCKLPTQGAALGGDGVVDMGIGAHITAASPRGPRYDASLTSLQRRDASNGIWCCTAHARLIDADEKQFPVELLRKWKRQAEEASARALFSLERTATPASSEDLDEAERAQVLELGLTPPEDLAAVTARLRAAAREDLRAFRQALRMPRDAVALNLRLLNGKEERAFTALGLGSVATLFTHVTVVAPPGTGKTITLLQATEATLNRDDLVAVFVPLGEWSAQARPLLESIAERRAFDGLRAEHLKLAAIHGRLVLALDGWNELDRESVRRLRAELSALERDFPNLCTLMSTRRQALDVPRTGPTVEIDSLSHEQQQSIAWAIRGSAGEVLLDQAWRAAGLRDLVAIPLYLTTLLTHSDSGHLPTTKEEVFRLFLNEHERSGEKAEALYAATLGFHLQMLEALAVETTRMGNVALPEAHALKAIGAVQEQLVTGRQQGAVREPKALLEALINYHVLLRLGGAGGAVAFQHQQFQEFFASAKVETLMRGAANGDQGARRQLRRDILNEYVWEESILFACERASRADEPGRAAVAAAVRDALSIDPMLAAEMISRSSPELWADMSAEIVSFGKQWHASGKVDRAVRFMVDTGRPEFAPFVWPLIAIPDRQVYFPALRAGKRFRLSVLGADVERLLRGLPDEQRQDVVSEIAVNGDYDGIEFVTRFAAIDPSPKVRAAAIEYLLFRRANRQALTILRDAPDEVWRLLAAKGFVAQDISDPAAAERLQTERRRLEESDGNLARALHRAVEDAREGADSAALVQALIENPDLPLREPNDATSAIHEAHQFYPKAVQSGLIYRLEHDLKLPFRSYELLAGSGLAIDSGPIVDLIVTDSDNEAAAAAATVVGERTVGWMIDEFRALGKKAASSSGSVSKDLSDKYWQLRRLIGLTPPRAFAHAVKACASITAPDEIGMVAALIGEHGTDHERPARSYEPRIREDLGRVIGAWAELLLATPNATRRELADTATAIGRLASPELLPVLLRMLAEELRRWRASAEALRAAQTRGKPVRNDAQMSWAPQYRRALLSIGGENVIQAMLSYLPDRGQSSFGADAAAVLYELWERDNRPRSDGRMGWRQEFVDVRARRQARQSASGDPVAPASQAIFAVVEELASSPDDVAQLHALKLARVALGMPYGDRTATIEKLLSLPQALSAKRDLLHALVLAGEVISAHQLVNGIRALLEQAKAQPWVLDPQQGYLNHWVQLLPFSDRPKVILEVLALLPPHLREPRQLTSLLAALGEAPSDEAEEVLGILARENEEFLQHYEWYGALEKRRTTSAMRLLIGLAMEGRLEDKRGREDLHLAQNLAFAMNSDPAFRAEVYRAFEALAPSRGRRLMGMAMLEAADTQAVLLFVRDRAQHGRPFDGELYRALERVAIDRRLSSQWIGAHELVGQPVPELRKALFAFVAARAPEAEIAAACLNAIDELRDEHGPAEAEPRHPDIESDIPWPQPR